MAPTLPATSRWALLLLVWLVKTQDSFLIADGHMSCLELTQKLIKENPTKFDAR